MIEIAANSIIMLKLINFTYNLTNLTNIKIKTSNPLESRNSLSTYFFGT